jgi:S1-C subfamily serine protease
LITKDGFTIRHDDGVVTISRSVKDGTSFDAVLDAARSMLTYFKMRDGSEWGCDGVGYDIQKRIGLVRVNRSGVTAYSFNQGITAIRERKNNDGG